MQTPTVKKLTITTNKTNEVGIPEVHFVENVPEYLKDNDDATAEQAIEVFDRLFRRYNMMQLDLQAKRDHMKTKIPEIASTLEMVEKLIAAEEDDETIETDFNLSHHLFAKASIKPEGRVGLWLGANVMVEYSYSEAKEMLETNLVKAKAKLDEHQRSLDFVRDQTNTTRVNVARIYNFDVVSRKKGLKM
eukprot:TRINITY_DN773342_c0_g1_i1.p1 TRINITY_DN773342_c0_g1~~TRINITY_DN773342_c0_g1_i1.p1  ORF type:complete len:190 (-),score=57.37 TRINITY_DN773342_c0_g1_i1:126-695(-)